MSALEMSHVDLEYGVHHIHSSFAGSQFFSTTGSSYDENRFAFVSKPEAGIGTDPRRDNSGSDCPVAVGIKSEEGNEMKVHLGKVERECRICQMGLESNSHESGIAIELGCSCKADLAAAHKHCAETWFKIKGNMTCEICRSVASNVNGAPEIDSNSASSTATVAHPLPPAETHRSFWHGHRVLNFLLACVVFTFVLSWLFHFNMPA